jgi:lysyl-tRNA synthetase class 2
MEDKSELLRAKREKIENLIKENVELYPNDVKVTATSADIANRYAGLNGDSLHESNEFFQLAGRIMARRVFGKAAFIHLKDRKGSIQVYLRKETLGEKTYNIFKKLDIGDIVFVSGRPFKTHTGELTIEADCIRLLSKAVRPLPEKWHGLTDIEARYRQRYLDLIMNPDVKDTFYRRSRIISLIRQFMEKRDFLEVETPMMHPIAGGATARPFKTHHNALDMDLYLRIAPELYLKRLIVGGLDRVFEINRNFRNEGISISHNPEFTMMEFYQAYATYEDLMNLTEDLIISIAQELFGSLSFMYQGTKIDLRPPWRKVTVKEAIIEYTGCSPSVLEDKGRAVEFAKTLGADGAEGESLGKAVMAIFECAVEEKLVQPTFVTQYPIEVSPLSRKNPVDVNYTDRFELYIYGREIANAFSELNDPEDQRNRFLMQLMQKNEGDDEAHEMDEDYITALEYAMPPAAGEGIGIDRLIMLFTDSPSIRDVILFPHMRSKLQRS